ncbi:hypothetical protein GGI20_005186 [Coemansia sp. BCRC 34301]|nr:hypothetical protein GGI20_005186 [Coemansia sp. BCRC 34301]
MDSDWRRKEFWQTLLAMGFQAQASCTGAYSGVILDWRVFERGTFHTRAAELILYFLFGHIDSARVRRDFFDCWPIGSPQQAREFRGRAFKWLDEMRRASSDSARIDVAVRRSDVDECRGVRFEAVLWALAGVAARAQLRSLARRPLDADAAPEDVALALQRCRARYGRNTRDRRLAIGQWRDADAALRRLIGAAEDGRDRVHAQFRAERRRAGGMDDVPGVDEPAAGVERRLAARVAQASRLWGDCAAWVEGMQGAVEAVEKVADRRANGVRLEARHVRLAPAPAMADAWARWLALPGRPAPFRGADVSLHAVAAMAGACVGALRNSLDSAPVELDSAPHEPLTPLGDVAERMRVLDSAIGAQDVRLARLRRLRAQLIDQRAKVAATLEMPPAERCQSLAVAALRAAVVRQPVPMSDKTPVVEPSRAARLAGVWDDLLEEEGGYELPRSSLSFMSDAVLSLPRKRVPPAATDHRADAFKRLRPLPLGGDVPDFLVN